MYKGEFFNSISHLVGASLALIGATVLITLAAVEGNELKTTSLVVYGLTLFLLFLASTLYHSIPGRAKQVLQKLDHGAIFLLIAGTYTPISLLALDGTGGWLLLCIIWSLAGIGIIVDNLPLPGPRVVPVLLYMIMGWLSVLYVDPLISGMGPASFAWLVAGGLMYNIGVVFFALDTLYPWCHKVWHVFVLGGAGSHFVAISML